MKTYKDLGHIHMQVQKRIMVFNEYFYEVYTCKRGCLPGDWEAPMYIELVKYPDVFLRFVSKDVPFPLDEKTERLIKWMYKAMYQHHGIGLAAIQIGVPKRVVVMDLAKNDEKKNPMYFPTRLQTNEKEEPHL